MADHEGKGDMIIHPDMNAALEKVQEALDSFSIPGVFRISGGLHDAALHLNIAAGIEREDEDAPFPWPPEDPIWLQLAGDDLIAALDAWEEIRVLLMAALAKVRILEREAEDSE